MKNNLFLISSFSIIFGLIAIPIESVHTEQEETISEKPKFFVLQRMLSNIDEMVNNEIIDTNGTTIYNLTLIMKDGNEIDHEPRFFAIQYANSGSISEINSTAYLLEFSGVSDKTILFSDRPDRIVLSMNTSNYIDNWKSGKDSFELDPPNAVLVLDELKVQEIIIVELSNPVYDHENERLKYDVTPDNSTVIDISGEFGKNTIVIDMKIPKLTAQSSLDPTESSYNY